jgi:hypothetical protein
MEYLVNNEEINIEQLSEDLKKYVGDSKAVLKDVALWFRFSPGELTQFLNGKKTFSPGDSRIQKLRVELDKEEPSFWRRKCATLEDHLEIARELSKMVQAYRYLVYKKLPKHYGKTSKVRKLFRKLSPYMIFGEKGAYANGVLLQIKNTLDKELGKVLNREEYSEYGNIYYNLNEESEKFHIARTKA